MNADRSRLLCSFVSLSLVALALSACTTDYVALRYAPTTPAAAVTAQTPVVSVGAFQDARGTEPTWIGAIRGGYGNPVKTLRSQGSVEQMVGDAFADGLRAHGVLAEAGQGPLELTGTIQKLDCSQYFNIEAHAHIDLRLVDRASGKERFSTRLRVDESEGGWGPGIFGSIENLRGLLERALTTAVDRALSNPEMRAAIASP